MRFPRVPRTAAYLLFLALFVVLFGAWVVRDTGTDNGSRALEHYVSHLNSSLSRTTAAGVRTSLRVEGREEAGDFVVQFELLDEASGVWGPLIPSFPAGVELNGHAGGASMQANGRCEARIPMTRFNLHGRANDLEIWIHDPAGQPLFVEHATGLRFRDRSSWWTW